MQLPSWGKATSFNSDKFVRKRIFFLSCSLIGLDNNSFGQNIGDSGREFAAPLNLSLPNAQVEVCQRFTMLLKIQPHNIQKD